VSRIDPLSKEQAHADAHFAYEQDERAWGFILNPTGVLAYRPPILAAARTLGLARCTAKKNASRSNWRTPRRRPP
jgi:hypothetical protein